MSTFNAALVLSGKGIAVVARAVYVATMRGAYELRALAILSRCFAFVKDRRISETGGGADQESAARRSPQASGSASVMHTAQNDISGQQDRRTI